MSWPVTPKKERLMLTTKTRKILEVALANRVAAKELADAVDVSGLDIDQVARDAAEDAQDAADAAQGDATTALADAGAAQADATTALGRVAVNVPEIADPTLATAEDVANAFNDLVQALIAAGLMAP